MSERRKVMALYGAEFVFAAREGMKGAGKSNGISEGNPW
jgi:hypothetical protein